jgi:hypothetical protein
MDTKQTVVNETSAKIAASTMSMRENGQLHCDAGDTRSRE